MTLFSVDFAMLPFIYKFIDYDNIDWNTCYSWHKDIRKYFFNSSRFFKISRFQDFKISTIKPFISIIFLLDFGTGHDVFSGEECGGLQYFTLCFSYYDIVWLWKSWNPEILTMKIIIYKFIDYDNIDWNTCYSWHKDIRKYFFNSSRIFKISRFQDFKISTIKP
jgi:hypothetical protein